MQEIDTINKIYQPKLRQEALYIQEELIQIRRHIHMYPETKYEEFETAKFIVNKLQKLGNIEIKTKVGQTGVVGILKGAFEGPCILLRADMDALDLQEDSGESFSSQIKGKHHACGHDGHVSMLLGAAFIISKWQQKLKGTIKFVFQPAEEGGSGALAMIEDKIYPVLENPKVDKCFGIHLQNSRYFPFVGCNEKEGPITANSDRFYVDIEGIGTHAMCPQNGVDAVFIGSQIVNAFYQIKPRSLDPLTQHTISIGTINGGTLPNIISQKCSLSGTTRSMFKEDRQQIQKRMTDICKGFEITFNCQIKFQYNQGYNSVYNWQNALDDVLISANKIVKTENTGFGLAGEDFFFFSERINSAYFLIGSAPIGSVKDGGRTVLRPHHGPFFTIDENALTLGTSIWIQLVEDLLVKLN